MKKSSFIFIALVIGLVLLVPAGFSLASEIRAPEVRAFDTLSGNRITNFLAYSRQYGGGVAVDSGNLVGDAQAEIVTVSRFGGRTHVRGFTNDGQFMGTSFFPFHPGFQGDADIATGDVNGDGFDEIIAAQSSDGEARVKVYKADGLVLASFLAFDAEFKGGAFVSTADIDGDGKSEIIAGAGRGGGPHVRIFNQYGYSLNLDIYPFSADFTGGVDVAGADVDKDGQDEIIVSAASAGQARIKVYRPDVSRTVVSNFLAYPADYQDGVRIDGGDIDKDGAAEIVAGVSYHSAPQVRTFETDGRPARFSLFAYEEEFRGGVDVATGDLSGNGRSEIVTGPGRFFWQGRRDLNSYIDIDLTNQRLSYFEGGRKVLESITSTGRPGMETPTGEFSVLAKDKMHWSGQYGLYMPYSLRFYGSYWIHDLPEWPGGYKEGANHLGIRVSHGCVRLETPKAVQLFDMAEVGTPVLIHY